MEPFRALLKKDATFLWLEVHEQTFAEAKRRLSSTSILAYFDAKRPTLLATDASRLNGLGFVLLQKIHVVWKPILAGSRFITPTERRYATTEQEALAACWANEEISSKDQKWKQEYSTMF